jgi:hypothetical protein
MTEIPQNQINVPEFNDYLLKSRLNRVSQTLLEKFLSGLKDIKDIPKNRENLTNEIVDYYKIMKSNSEFSIKFGSFIRDYVLSAGQSEYLIHVDNHEGFINWVIDLNLGEKFLSLSQSEDGSENIEITQSIEDKESQYLSFPSKVFLLVGYNQNSKSVFSKDKLIDFYETIEFEIILRKDCPLVGIRGNYGVVRDFFTSAILDTSNSLSMVQSIFIGEFDSKKSRPIAKPRKVIEIEKLRKAIDGCYLDIDAPVSGDQATRIKFSLKGMKDIQEETHPTLSPVLKDVLAAQEKSRIGFQYNNNDYSFSVTVNGGLYFRQFAPEEVTTYILLKISQL